MPFDRSRYGMSVGDWLTDDIFLTTSANRQSITDALCRYDRTSELRNNSLVSARLVGSENVSYRSSAQPNNHISRRTALLVCHSARIRARVCHTKSHGRARQGDSLRSDPGKICRLGLKHAARKRWRLRRGEIRSQGGLQCRAGRPIARSQAHRWN